MVVELLANIHLLLTKEELENHPIEKKNVAVVIDVLLATSTIVTSLYYGAKEVIPTLNRNEALAKTESLEKGSFHLIGEYKGKKIDGFTEPLPLEMKKKIKNEAVILSTTNGTVAIRNAATAKKVYISSLLNGHAVAKEIAKKHKKDMITVVCSGSRGTFCLEDFYGAGYLINELVKDSPNWQLTDPAKAALIFYEQKSTRSIDILESSSVGQMLIKSGLKDELEFSSRQGILSIAPYLTNDKIIVNGC